MYETLSKQQLDAMTSDQYKQNFEGPNGDEFRQRVSELENAPRTATRPRGNVRGDEVAPTPSMTSFDPSFDDEPAAAAAPAAAPAAAAPGALAIWRYQPRDAEGRPVGGEQIFKYDPSLPVDDPKSLASQLTKAHSYATTALKAKRTQAMLDDVKQVATGYKPPVFLTADQHPEFEALNEVTRNTINNGTLSAMNSFRQAHPEFVANEDNAAAMVKWVEKSGRNPVDAMTWELAWTALKPYIAPEVVVEAVSAPAPVAAPAPARVAAGVPVALSDVDQFNDEPVVVAAQVHGAKIVIDGKAQIITLQAWENQSSDFQKRVLRSQSNASQIEALYNDAVEHRRRRR
jgi:hypothetical protein